MSQQLTPEQQERVRELDKALETFELPPPKPRQPPAPERLRPVGDTLGQLLHRAAGEAKVTIPRLVRALRAASWSSARLAEELPDPGWKEALRREGERHRKERVQAARERADLWLESAGLPEWPYARLSNPAWAKLVDAALLLAARKWNGARGLVFAGHPSGAGKSSAIVAAVHARHAAAIAAIERGAEPPELPRVRWVSMLGLLAARRSQSLGDDDPRPLTTAKTIPVLVIDEAGFEGFDGLSIPLLFDMVDARYCRAELVTCLTTGLTSEAFSARYGVQVWRRLAERADVVEAKPTRRGNP